MATSGTVREGFAKTSGALLTTWSRIQQILRDAEMAPKGEAGRGLKHGHYQAPHLCNMLLAGAGAQPSDAADAVLALRPLQLVAGVGKARIVEFSRFSEMNLGQVIESIILDLSSDLGTGEWKKATSHNFVLTLCVKPAFAKMLFMADTSGEYQEFHFCDNTDVRTVFVPASRFEPLKGIRRSSSVGFDMLEVAGALFRDTLANQEREIEGNSTPLLTPPNENAAPARAAHRDQAENSTQDRNTLDNRRERETAQALSSRKPGSSPNRHRENPQWSSQTAHP